LSFARRPQPEVHPDGAVVADRAGISTHAEVDMGIVSLIVMEPGSAWPGHIGDSENVVAAGCDDETLLPRVQHMLDALRARGQGVRVAVLACNGETDPRSAGRRADLARELRAAVAHNPCGRLVLCATEQASRRLRGELLSLTGRLTQQPEGGTATVSLRFGGASDENPLSAGPSPTGGWPRGSVRSSTMGERSRRTRPSRWSTPGVP
jgi:hypothetical protein